MKNVDLIKDSLYKDYLPLLSNMVIKKENKFSNENIFTIYEMFETEKFNNLSNDEMFELCQELQNKTSKNRVCKLELINDERNFIIDFDNGVISINSNCIQNILNGNIENEIYNKQSIGKIIREHIFDVVTKSQLAEKVVNIVMSDKIDKNYENFIACLEFMDNVNTNVNNEDYNKFSKNSNKNCINLVEHYSKIEYLEKMLGNLDRKSQNEESFKKYLNNFTKLNFANSKENLLSNRVDEMLNVYVKNVVEFFEKNTQDSLTKQTILNFVVQFANQKNLENKLSIEIGLVKSLLNKNNEEKVY